jgi:hypothetical protein
MAVEQWSLDGLDLHDPSAGLKIRGLQRTIARRRAAWLENPDTDGAVLGQVPRAGLMELVFRLQYHSQANMDAALVSAASLIDKLEACKLNPEGLGLEWTPHNSTKTVAFRALLGEVIELPIELGGDGYGWFRGEPVLVVSLTCLPFWEGEPLEDIVDAFASDSIADYTFDAGAAGNVSITGGVMDAAANLTTENRLWHDASTYDLYDAQVTVKHTLGTTLTNYKAGVILKRVDASNYLEAYVDDTGAASRLRIDRVLAGARTNLVSTTLTRMTVSTAYWVRGRLEGTVVVAEHWTSAPTITGTATSANTTTLAGADATAFGRGVAGRAGLVWTPQQTAANLDDFRVQPNLWRTDKPIVSGEIFGVPGDAPALGELNIADGEGQNRRYAQWGSGKGGAWAHILDSDDLVTSGFQGTGDTASGAYDGTAGGNSTVSATLLTLPAAICGTGELTHIGTFRAFARVLVTTSDCHLRFVWQDKDGPKTANAWASPATANLWADVPLGVITLVSTGRGDQVWSGQLEAYTDTTASLDVDFIGLIPVDDGQGVSRSIAPNTGGVVSAFDNFTSTTAGNALSTRTPVTGAAWSTSGAATDFAFSDLSIEFGVGETLRRGATGTRFAVFGSSITDTVISSRMNYSGEGFGGLIARWADANNYLRATYNDDTFELLIVKTVGGVATTLLQVTDDTYPSFSEGTGGVFRLTVRTSGYVLVERLNAAGTTVISSFTVTDPVLAAGGTLATGKPGVVHDGGAGSAGVYFDDITVMSLDSEPLVICSGQNMLVLHDEAVRADSDSGRYGALPTYRPAGHFYVQPAGDDGRSTHVAARAHRNDLAIGSYETIDDILQVQALWTPRGNAIPR